MSRRKRNATEAELDVSLATSDAPISSYQPEILTTIRNMWEFASLMQWIFMFGHIVKIDEDFDIEDLEHECLQPSPSPRLASFGLAMLKLISSHRGLTPEIFSEYTRRQYLAKAPSRNPFGDEDEPIPFNDLDIITRLRVLQQLSTWTFTNAERVRGMMGEEEDHLNWRMEPLGWDADDVAYFVLDDNRLYSRTDEAPPAPVPTPKKTKAKARPASKKKRKVTKALPPPTRGTRTSSRLKVTEESEPDDDDDEDVMDEDEAEVEEIERQTDGAVPEDSQEESGFGFTSKTWKCVAITLPEYQVFLDSIKKSRDPNEKTLRRRIEEEVLPIIEKRAEALRQKQMKKLRELENIQKMATAKRSSRIADKAEKQAKEDEERREEEKKIADLRMAREEQLKQKRIEEGHESRRLTREQRLKDREVKRILHEEELARLEREGSAAGSLGDVDAGTVDRKRSSRNIQNQKELLQKELAQLEHDQKEDAWYFDCVVCGMHGDNLDDGSHSVACERCSVWQHSACHGFTPEQCENDDFHFICSTCRRKEREEQEQKEQRSGLILKLGKRAEQADSDTIAVKPRTEPEVKQEVKLPDFVQQQLNSMAQRQQQPNERAAVDQSPYQPPRQTPVKEAMQSSSPYQPQINQAHTGQAYPSANPNYGTSSSHMSQHNLLHQSAVNGHVGHAGHMAHPPPQFVQYSPPQRQAAMATHNGQQQNQTQVSPPRHHLQPAMALPGQHNQSQSHQTMATGSYQPTRPIQQTNQPVSRPLSNHGHVSLPAASSPPQYNGVAHTPRPVSFGSPLIPEGSEQRATPLPSSPGTSLLPPKPDYNRQAAISPVKSSPPRAPPQASPPVQSMTNGQAHSGEQALRTHKDINTPNGSFEHVPKLESPGQAGEVAVAPANHTAAVAEHGMQGPWPNGVLSVPTKNDAPPHQH